MPPSREVHDTSLPSLGLRQALLRKWSHGASWLGGLAFDSRRWAGGAQRCPREPDPSFTAGPQEEKLEGAALCPEEGAGFPALLRPFQSEYRVLAWSPCEASGHFSPRQRRQLAPHPSLTQHPYHNLCRTVPLLPHPAALKGEDCSLISSRRCLLRGSSLFCEETHLLVSPKLATWLRRGRGWQMPTWCFPALHPFLSSDPRDSFPSTSCPRQCFSNFLLLVNI